MKVPSQIKISVNGTCVSHSRTDIKARKHSLTIDEPEIRGGTDTAMTPLETFFSSYAACLNVIANTIIHDMDVDVQIGSVDIQATFETAAYVGKGKVEKPFSEIKVVITAVANCSDAELASVKRDLAWRCPISQVLSLAGLNLQEQWSVTRS